MDLAATLQGYAVSEIAAFALAVARVAGVILVAPFPGQSVPNRMKVGLVLILAYLGRAAAPDPFSGGLDLRLLGLACAEVGIGLLIGFTVRVTFSASEVLGSTFAQSTGLTMGQVYDPALGGEEPVIARIATLSAMLLFLGAGAHRVLLGYALESFRAVPLGHGVDLAAAAPILSTWVGQALEAGVRLSLPVTAVALSVQVALALVARASPSLQVFNVGMGVTVAAGLLAILGSAGDVTSGIGTENARVGPRIEEILAPR